MTVDCTFYSKQTGAITLTASLSPESLQMYAGMAEPFIVDVLGDSDRHYVSHSIDEDGRITSSLVEFTPEEYLAKISLAPGWVWQMPERIAADRRTTEYARSQVSARVNGERDRRIASFDRFAFNGVAIRRRRRSQREHRRCPPPARPTTSRCRRASLGARSTTATCP